MPFYLVMKQFLGYAPKGRRAKTPVYPIGGMSYQTQVAMVVHAHKGVLFGGVFPPAYSLSVSQDGSVGYETLKAKFKENLDVLLRSSFTRRDELGLRGKHVVAVGWCA